MRKWFYLSLGSVAIVIASMGAYGYLDSVAEQEQNKRLHEFDRLTAEIRSSRASMAQVRAKLGKPTDVLFDGKMENQVVTLVYEYEVKRIPLMKSRLVGMRVSFRVQGATLVGAQAARSWH